MRCAHPYAAGEAQIIAASVIVKEDTREGLDFALIVLPSPDTDEDSTAYNRAMGQAIPLDDIASADISSQLLVFEAEGTDPGEMAQWIQHCLIGHPFGCAKRASCKRPGAAGEWADGIGHTRCHHMCASYGGSSGGPVLAFASQVAQASMAADAPFYARLALRIEERAIQQHHWHAVHWGAEGSASRILDQFLTLLRRG